VWSDRTLESQIDECRELSDSELLLIPGIEFTCTHRFHLIGLGIQKFIADKDPVDVARKIRDQNGLAIVAHPTRYDYEVPPGLEDHLTGIEIWSARYDGTFVPNDQSIRLLKDLRKRNTSLIGFGGQDLHQIGEDAHVAYTLDSTELSAEAVLRNLRNGEFDLSTPEFRLPSTWMSDRSARTSMWLRQRYLQARKLAGQIKRKLTR